MNGTIFGSIKTKDPLKIQTSYAMNGNKLHLADTNAVLYLLNGNDVCKFYKHSAWFSIISEMELLSFRIVC